jgi:hypothetical protein
LGVWSLPIFAVLFSIGWYFIAHFLPPHDPSASADKIASIFRAHSVSIRVGMYIVMYSALFQIPFGAVVAAQIARIEGGSSHFWTYAVVMNVAGQVLTITFPAAMWEAAAFRPERAPELILLLSDLGWVSLIGMTVPLVGMPIIVAIAGFLDKSDQPAIPRWACWLSLAAATFLIPSGFVIFVSEGPFAWNGLFGYWVPVADNFTWYMIMFAVLRRAVLRQIENETVGSGVRP